MRVTTYVVLAASLLCVNLLMSACATATPTASSPAPTATPSLPNLQRIHLTSFQASDIIPMAHGMLLLGTPGATGQPHDTPEEFGGRPKGLFYFDFATSAISTLISFPSTSNESVLSETGAGDWALYTTGVLPEVSETEASTTLWATNVTTHERIKLDASSFSNDAPKREIRTFRTDGSVVVWSFWLANDTINPGGSVELHEYDLKTHHSQPLAKATMPSSASFLYLDPVGFMPGKILYDEFITPFSDQIKSYPQDGLYLLNLATGVLRHLSVSGERNGHLGGQYVVWDNQQPRSLGLYNINTNAAQGVWSTACIRPDIAADGSYVACLDYQNRLAMLVQVPSGAQMTLGLTTLNARGTIANGRVYWLVPEGYTEFGTEVDVWPLPSR